MFDFRSNLVVLLKATLFICAAIFCLMLLFHVTRFAVSSQARSEILWTFGLSQTLPGPGDDEATATSSSESYPITGWVQDCAGIDDVHTLPLQIRYLFVSGSFDDKQPPVRRYVRIPNQAELSLLRLNASLNRQRIALAKRAQSAYRFWQISSLVVIGLGAASTIMIGLSSTQFGRESGRTQQLMRTLAIVFPALGTAATAAITFYGPQTEWTQSSATLANLSQVHRQVATELALIDCSSDDYKNNGTSLLARLNGWSQKYVEIMAASDAAPQPKGETGNKEKDKGSTP